MSNLNTSCFAVFHGTRQLRVLISNASYYCAYDKAVEFANLNAANGYKCTVEEFSCSAEFGTLVYTTI